jgi:hypothetical protein
VEWGWGYEGEAWGVDGRGVWDRLGCCGWKRPEPGAAIVATLRLISEV